VKGRALAALLGACFFASGAAALCFEALWFRQAGLAFGNSIWASSLVLAGFMAGMALGNLAAARYGDRLGDPIRAYAGLELAVGVLGRSAARAPYHCDRRAGRSAGRIGAHRRRQSSAEA
jgi:spermidine synthase